MTDIFVNMITLLLILLIASCIMSVDPPDYNEEARSNKGIAGYNNLLMQRLWETSNLINESYLFNIFAKNREYDDLNIKVMPKEQKLHNALTMEYMQLNKRRFVRDRKRSRSKKDYDILMDDITYGIFGNCYNNSLLSDQPFVMIDRCPRRTRDINDVRLCQSSPPMNEFDECSINLQLVPVSDSRGYIYKNIYCARCHGIQDVTTWEVELIYNSLSALRFSESDSSVLFLGKLPEASKCTPFMYPLKPKSKFLCKYHHHHNRHGYRDFIESQSPKEYPLSFQILMNFGINGKGHVFFSTSAISPFVQHTCEDNAIYDPKIHQCRRVVCKNGYVLIDKKCIPKSQKYDTISDQHINDATTSEYPIQIIYRFNVSKSDVLQLKTQEACDHITDAFATMLNISIDRIFGFKINVINGTLDEKTAEIRQIANTAAGHSIHTNLSSESCNVDINVQSLAETLNSFTAVFSFSIFPSIKNGSSTTNETLKDKILNLKGSFNFAINGTKFQAENPGATTPVQLDLWCTKGIKHQKFNNEFELLPKFDSLTGKNYTSVYVNSTGKFYLPGMYDLWLWVSGKIGNISGVSTFMYVFVCDMPKIADKDCARFQIGDSNYTRLRNTSVLLEDKRVIDVDGYEYVCNNGTKTDIQVCVPESYLISPPSSLVNIGCGKSYKTVLIAEGYLSFVLGIISIIVLALIIVTYALLEKLRNLPGLNVMCLTLSLFLGELLFIMSGSIEQGGGAVCSAVGASLHFLFLSSFFWMNVMSYDVFRTFGNKCILKRIRRSKTYFPRYSCYAWGFPALIVAICCILEYTRLFPNMKIGYGGQTGVSYYYEESGTDNATSNNPNVVKLSPKKFGCWIQEPVAALVVFGFPMIGIVFANSIMFIRTIICIRSVTKMVSVRTRRSSGSAIGQHDVMLYVRMSTVMGFTWVFGLASSIVSSFTESPSNAVCILLHTLGMLFIIFNCSQGLFIFFVFVLNKRVCSLYKQLLSQFRYKFNRKLCASSGPLSPSLSTVSERTHL